MLQILEICLVALSSNAKLERVFSLLWCIFSKECQSLKHDTLEIILQLGFDNDKSKERYGDAAEVFKRIPRQHNQEEKCNLQGYMYLSNQASLKKRCHDAASALLNVSSDEKLEEQINAPENVPPEGISDDEWSSDDE